MIVQVIFVICAILCSYVQSSSIFTKEMMRMPKGSSPAAELSYNRSLEPQQLIASTESSEYQRIFPPKYEDRNENTSLLRPLGYAAVFSNLKNNTTPRPFHTAVENSTSKTLSDDLDQKKEKDIPLKQAWTSNHDFHLENNFKEQSAPYTPNISSEEISKSYWERYKNFSYDLFNTSNALQTSVNDKELKSTKVWDVLQRLYECPWSLGILHCLRDSFQDQVESFLLSSESQFPRFHQWDNPLLPSMDADDSDTDEGRRKLSKKLQMLLPILMMLKMSMLPALAVMALVSGKAFLMSLLSLGVAVVAAFAHPAALSASKRHEIAPQAPSPAEQHLPSSYYYVM